MTATEQQAKFVSMVRDEWSCLESDQETWDAMMRLVRAGYNAALDAAAEECDKEAVLAAKFEYTRSWIESAEACGWRILALKGRPLAGGSK